MLAGAGRERVLPGREVHPGCVAGPKELQRG